MFFCHTNINSLSCPGPSDSSRVVTMQVHRLGRLCCSVHPSLVHFSRNMAVFQMLQGNWNFLLRGAVGSLCFTEMTWPCLLQLLLREEAEPRLGGGRSFGPQEMLDYYSSSSCRGISKKVLFKSKRQARSSLSTLLSFAAGQVTASLGMTREQNVSQFSKGFLPTLVQSLVLLVPGSRLVLNQVPGENWKRLSHLKPHTWGLILITLTLPFVGSKAQLLTCSSEWQWVRIMHTSKGGSAALWCRILGMRCSFILIMTKTPATLHTFKYPSVA